MSGVVVEGVGSKIPAGSCLGWIDESNEACVKCLISEKCRKAASARMAKQTIGTQSKVMQTLVNLIDGVPKTSGTSRCVVFAKQGKDVATVMVMADGRVNLTTVKGCAAINRDDVAGATKAANRLL